MTNKEQPTKEDERYEYGKAYLSKDLVISDKERDLARKVLMKAEKVGKVIHNYIDLNYHWMRWECGMRAICAKRSDIEIRLSLLPKFHSNYGDVMYLWYREDFFSFDNLEKRRGKRDELEKKLDKSIKSLKDDAVKDRYSAVKWANGDTSFKVKDLEMKKAIIGWAEAKERKAEVLSSFLKELLETPYSDRNPINEMNAQPKKYVAKEITPEEWELYKESHLQEKVDRSLLDKVISLFRLR